MDIIAIFKLLGPVLPILAPILVSMIKEAMPKVMAQVDDRYKPLISALFGIFIAVLSGLASGDISVTGLAAGAGLGLGGAKLRDLAVGKPHLVDKK